jgi:hypothetical protein
MNIRRLMLISPLALIVVSSSAAATCLSIERDNTSSYWRNRCNHAVTVRWTGDNHCRNWGCRTTVRGGDRQTASDLRGRVSWCECAGYGCEPGRAPRGVCE